MLDALLEKLGGLLPKNFIIAAFFPVLLFAGANGVMYYLTVASFRGWVERYAALEAGQQAFYGLPLLLIVAVAAYVFSMLNLSLRRTLEGEPPLLPERIKEWLRRLLAAGQRARLDRLESQLKEHKRRWWQLKRRENQWHEILNAAWAAGKKQSDARCDYAEDKPAAKAVDGLVQKRAQNILISHKELDEAVRELARELSKCDVGERKPADPDIEQKRLLDDEHETLRELIRYAVNRAEDEYAARYNRREYNYSRFRVAPTKMGNVAESVRSYALSRYGMNLDPFWLRVQKLVQEDRDFYASLLDAKTQLDFLVSLCWLTIIFTVFWLVYLVYLRQSVWLFIGIGLAGPALALMWYEIAVQNYLAFADVLRTALDLYRFKLLDALHISRPADSWKERQTWDELNRLIGYGDALRIPYKPEARVKPEAQDKSDAQVSPPDRKEG